MGADIGSRTFGWGRVEIDTERQRFIGAIDVGGIVQDKPKEELLTQSLYRRSWGQGRALPDMGRVGAVVVESLVLSNKGIGATAGAAMCWGMLIGVCLVLRIPLYEIRTPWWQHQLLRTKGKEINQDALCRHMETFIRRSPALPSYRDLPQDVRGHARDGLGMATVGSVRLSTLHRVSTDVMAQVISIA